VRDLGPLMPAPDFPAATERAADKLLSDLAEQSPTLAGRLCAWLALRCDVSRPAAYFTNPESLPLLALPWWMEKTMFGRVDLQFQADLMYSTISLYYFSRMLDDVMDGHEVDLNTLPALYLLHEKFRKTYCQYFKPADPFWQVFERLLTKTAETAVVDATLADFTEAEFIQIAAKKTAAGAIPLAGVCFHYGRSDQLSAWQNIYALIARWHQMRDDLIDWSSDSKSGNRTWLLCEAERQKANDESVAMWIGRKGFTWTSAVMDPWMEKLLKMASEADCPELIEYLNARRQSFARQIEGLTAIAVFAEPLLHMDGHKDAHMNALQQRV
jgi:hypothetical protein